MAPPKMYRNKIRNIAPPTMVVTSSCGERMYLRSVRTATAAMVAPIPAVRAAGASRRAPVSLLAGIGTAVISLLVSAGSCRSCSLGRTVRLGAVAGLAGCPGQLEEHFVQRRAAQADVVDVDVEPAERLYLGGDRGLSCWNWDAD